jgi:hypothetical protein
VAEFDAALTIAGRAVMIIRTPAVNFGGAVAISGTRVAKLPSPPLRVSRGTGGGKFFLKKKLEKI